jgi:hypothetical protein
MTTQTATATVRTSIVVQAPDRARIQGVHRGLRTFQAA